MIAPSTSQESRRYDYPANPAGDAQLHHAQGHNPRPSPGSTSAQSFLTSATQAFARSCAMAVAPNSSKAALTTKTLFDMSSSSSARKIVASDLRKAPLSGWL